MDTVTPSERALAAERAWSLAKQRGDDRLRRAALAEYRVARREMRHPVVTLTNKAELSIFLGMFARPNPPAA